jgi:hypothetical protein
MNLEVVLVAISQSGQAKAVHFRIQWMNDFRRSCVIFKATSHLVTDKRRHNIGNFNIGLALQPFVSHGLTMPVVQISLVQRPSNKVNNNSSQFSRIGK